MRKNPFLALVLVLINCAKMLEEVLAKAVTEENVDEDSLTEKIQENLVVLLEKLFKLLPELNLKGILSQVLTVSLNEKQFLSTPANYSYLYLVYYIRENNPVGAEILEKIVEMYQTENKTSFAPPEGFYDVEIPIISNMRKKAILEQKKYQNLLKQLLGGIEDAHEPEERYFDDNMSH